MATIESFEQLEAWQKARILVNLVYSVSGNGQFARDFVLRDQVRRAAVSVMGNIAEGFERSGKAELLQFLSIAKGSVGELRTHLYIAHDQGYLNAKEFEELMALATRTAQLIGGFMNYLRRSNVRGTKFKVATAALT